MHALRRQSTATRHVSTHHANRGTSVHFNVSGRLPHAAWAMARTSICVYHVHTIIVMSTLCGCGCCGVVRRRGLSALTICVYHVHPFIDICGCGGCGLDADGGCLPGSGCGVFRPDVQGKELRPAPGSVMPWVMTWVAVHMAARVRSGARCRMLLNLATSLFCILKEATLYAMWC